MYFAHKGFLFSIKYKCDDGYIAEKEDGYMFKIPKEALKKYYKPVKKLDKEEMARGYIEMGLINKEEAEAGMHTYQDGMWFYK